MAIQTKIGGKTRTLVLGLAAFKMYKKETGKGLSTFMAELADSELDGVSDIIYCALRLGERKDKIAEPEEYDSMDVAIWMDEAKGGVAGFLQKIVEALPKAEAGEGESEPGEALTSGILTN